LTPDRRIQPGAAAVFWINAVFLPPLPRRIFDSPTLFLFLSFGDLDMFFKEAKDKS